MVIQSPFKNETPVHTALDTYVQAVQNKDFDTLKSCYAPNLLAYDMLPPLAYKGFQAYGKLWETCFSCFEGPIQYHQHDAQIHIDQDIAFAYALVRMGGNMKNEQGAEAGFMWFRSTLCFQQINQQWLIIHEHTSVPVDIETGKACMELQPV